MADVPTTPEETDENEQASVRSELDSARFEGDIGTEIGSERPSQDEGDLSIAGDTAGGDKLRPYDEPAATVPKSPTLGVFDSGIGGFTVASAILKRRPDLNLVYYADSMNLPYGGREQAQLERFAGNIIEFLLRQGIAILADGCNTSQSALSSGELRSFGVPAYDLVGCTIDSMREKQLPKALALLATEATVRAGWWERRLREAFPDIPVTPIAAPELVPLIEAQQPHDTALREAVGKYTRLIRESGADTVVLGCTHYPLVRNLMQEADVYLRYVDPAQCLADKLVGDLALGVAPTVRGTLQFYNSRPSERFYALGERVFGRPIRNSTKVYIVNPYED